MSDINPYAAPSVPDPLLPDRPPPGGAWRDGRMLVVHRLGGALPHICLLTGQPAEVRRWVSIRWSYPIDFSMRMTPVELGLSAPADRSHRRLEWGSAAYIVVAIGTVIGLAISRRLLPGAAFQALIFASFVTLAVAGFVYSRHSALLRFAKARGEYIWLRGAHPDFLACLPEWPGRR